MVPLIVLRHQFYFETISINVIINNCQIYLFVIFLQDSDTVSSDELVLNAKFNVEIGADMGNLFREYYELNEIMTNVA